ncbi:MAG: methyl-accepting chemotaxis protein [Tepidimonas ignava]|uniref:Methyl-accepting chemotaxis protein II n=1 Tax=Tepidimonas ignava TaxID=114249 RepID=A0A4V2UWA8_9BURK|nr:methyl-accepting chemotaxis protein [Tepidimonas ignava]TCS99007.1 methyl-accepting chemotaxis protein-2 (aspartate sensor receptor) [Tepidimonas ignava]TSE22910.1 Methyl-accepting chemotaxis protein II [Tepidimonas ignava]
MSPSTSANLGTLPAPHQAVVPWRHRIGVQVALLLAVAGLILVIGLVWFSVSMYRDERQARLDELGERIATVAAVIEQVDESGKRNAQRLYAEFEQLVPSVALSWSEVDGKRTLTLYGQALAGDFTMVDLFAQRSGGVATIFEREGDDFRRITTSLTKEDGSRAVGTLLGKDHPAYAAMMAGTRYVGRAVLFGRSYMTVYQPIKIDGQVAGILFVGYDLNNELGVLTRLLKAINRDRLIFAALDISQGARAGQWYGRDLPKLGADDALLQRLREATQQGQTDGVLEVADLQGLEGSGPVNLVWRHFPAWHWVVLAAERDAETTRASRDDMLHLWSLVAFSGAVVAVLLAWFVRTRLMRPLHSVVAALGALAQGRLSVAIPAGGRDEFGVLMRATEAMRRTWLDVVQRVHQASTGVANGAIEIAQGNQDLSERTERAAASLEQTTASLASLTDAVRQGADTARTANQLAMQAAESARTGGHEVQQAVASMQAIEASSQRIADITSVIDSIAFQTNILALNAAVEAARAGEAGRGFAVVAGEVRSLAQRSAEAARQIKALIEESVTAVRNGSQQVQHSGATIAEVVQSIQRVADLIGEVSASTAEQSDNIAQVNAAMGQLDQMTQQNAALVEQASAAAASLQQQAQALLQALQAFDVAAQAASAALPMAGAGPATSSPPAPSHTSAPAPKPAASKPLRLVQPAPRHHGAPSSAPASPTPSAQPSTPPARSAPGGQPSANASDDDWETF